MREIGINGSIGKLCLWWSAFVLVATDPGPLPLSATGRWVLMCDPGAPGAAGNEFLRGLQTSGLAWEGKLLWSVGDQRSVFPGHVFVIDPDSGKIINQVALKLKTPECETIEWVSPEGIAVDSDRGVGYIISDPDSTDGNWRLRSTPRTTGKFAEYVPLPFELKLPHALLESRL